MTNGWDLTVQYAPRAQETIRPVMIAVENAITTSTGTIHQILTSVDSVILA